MNEAYFHLTGMPTVEHKLSVYENKQLFQILKEYDDSNYLISAVSTAARKTGLLNNKGYTVIGVKEYNNDFLVRLRNPWGNEGFKGDWNDNDKGHWTTEAVKAMEQLDIPDGTFWMSFNDFKKNFS
jgi:hypothetical protein